MFPSPPVRGPVPKLHAESNSMEELITEDGRSCTTQSDCRPGGLALLLQLQPVQCALAFVLGQRITGGRVRSSSVAEPEASRTYMTPPAPAPRMCSRSCSSSPSLYLPFSYLLPLPPPQFPYLGLPNDLGAASGNFSALSLLSFPRASGKFNASASEKTEPSRPCTLYIGALKLSTIFTLPTLSARSQKGKPGNRVIRSPMSPPPLPVQVWFAAGGMSPKLPPVVAGDSFAIGNSNCFDSAKLQRPYAVHVMREKWPSCYVRTKVRAYRI